MSPASTLTRRAGLMVPLFSMASSRGWGIGEIGDLEAMTRWLAGAGQRLLQLLPINEVQRSETSPYSALSAMAIDPQYITMADVEDFHATGGEETLEPVQRARLDAARVSPSIDYATIRHLKHIALRRAFASFRDTELATGTRRASVFRAFRDAEAWWLDEYALFRALHAHHHEDAWTAWPEPLRDRHPDALADARASLADDILYRQYVQWIASDQWRTARARAGTVALFGDLPFIVSADSADVWARQDEFRLDASVGVPPDAFSDTGQDWGLPAYRWDVLRERDFDWLRHRARRNADLFDGYRVDHLVGFYRTYIRPHGETEGQFVPADEASQQELGEGVLAVFREPGAEIVAEDLGLIPDFVRESLVRQQVPGFRVFRWERQWHAEGHPFIEPETYPAIAVATSGTHDTEPMTVWWETAPEEERRAVLDIPFVRERLTGEARARALDERPLSPAVHEALLEVLFASGANLLILPIQDAFGWRDRINQPGTVHERNWTWRLPWPCDRLSRQPEAIAVANQLREWSVRHRRA